MSKLADPTLKTLVEMSPGDWLPLLRLPSAPVEVVDADIATTVAGGADKVLRVRAAPDYLLHLEFQSGHFDSGLLDRLELYNVVLKCRHKLPVRTVLVLLQPGTDSPRLTGVLEHSLPGEAPYFMLRYDILRVWQIPVERLLTGGLATLPLAFLSDVRQADLPSVVEKVEQRLRRGAERRLAPEVWTASYVLLGARYSVKVAQQLLRGVSHMIESVTYQAIVEEGELKMARKILLKLGRKRLGSPNQKASAAFQAITDLSRLESLSERILEVNSWEELLGVPRSRRKA